ncbi:hypothetical protein KIN20_013084 [Parelaphostrongylus tenuis]|uniref:Uncharacterized protein n=1 Tax=Parelaphostrongylus tenuis TaxID=148309 RepID=A0AAD5QKT6_PARTN|nr:hypothetical protein KIN20_013084 [Parelaphostrongylus tenuis]
MENIDQKIGLNIIRERSCIQLPLPRLSKSPCAVPLRRNSDWCDARTDVTSATARALMNHLKQRAIEVVLQFLVYLD